MKNNENFPFLANQTGKFSSLWHHGKHSYTDKIAELDLDSEKMFWLVNSHKSPFFRKIGWVSIPSKFWLMENFDRVNGALHIT